VALVDIVVVPFVNKDRLVEKKFLFPSIDRQAKKSRNKMFYTRK